MPAKRSGLGRGLDALLPKSEGAVQQVPLAKLRASALQPRTHFDAESLAELAASIRDKGVLQPLLVRPVAQGYEIVAGERRFRAATEAGLETVPVIIRTLNEQETLEIAIIENLQREDLSALEEAQAFKQLLGLGLNQEQVARAVGKSRSAVANTLRLLQLPEAALSALMTGEINAGHARAILSKPEQDRDWALEQIRSRDLTVRQAEALERKTIAKGSSRSRPREPHALEEELARTVGTRVAIKGQGKGKIELYYFSEEELSRLLELLGYQG